MKLFNAEDFKDLHQDSHTNSKRAARQANARLAELGVITALEEAEALLRAAYEDKQTIYWLDSVSKWLSKYSNLLKKETRDE